MNKNVKILIATLLGIIPIVLMAVLFDRYAVNIPHWDDHALKGFIVKFQSTDSIRVKLQELFALHNEHRIALTRFFTWLIFKIHGTIDYRIMMLVGNASLLGIWAFFIACINKYRLSAWYIVVSGWLLFSLAISENFFWGMAAISNFWILLWAFLTFYLLIFGNQDDIRNPFIKRQQTFERAKKTNRVMFIGAVFASFLALSTSGNGVIVPIIGLLIILIQKRFRTAILWLLTSGSGLLIYFLTYVRRPDEVNDVSDVTVSGLLNGSITLAGAIFDAEWAFPEKRMFISQLLGGLLIVVSATLFLRRLFVSYTPPDNQYVITKRKTDLFMSSALLFVGGTMAGIVLSRSGYGMDVFMTGKYKIYSIILLIVCVIYSGRLVPKSLRNAGIIASVLLSIGLWFNSYFNDYQFVLNQYMQRRVDLANWTIEAKAKGDSLSTYPYKAPVVSLFENIDFTNYEVADSLIDDIRITNDEVTFYENDLEAVNQRVYFILKSEQHTYYFSTRPQRNKSRIGIFSHYFQKGFTVNVSRFDVETDVYQPFILIKTNKTEKLLTTEKLIRIKGIKRPEREINW